MRTEFSIAGYNFSFYKIIESILIPYLITIVVAIIIYAFAKIILLSIYNVNKDKDLTVEESRERKEKKRQQLAKIKKRIRRILFLLVIVAFVIILFKFIGTLGLFPNVTAIFTRPLYSSGKTSISIFSLILMLILGYVSYWISGMIRKTTKMFVSRFPKEVAKKYMPLVHIVGYGTLTLTFIVGLSVIGIDITSFVVLFGVLGVGIGFGLQDIIANFFSGLIIGFTRIITEGDRVFIKDIEGDVQQINLINTVIRGITDEELIVPNKFILNESIQNYSHSDNFAVIGTSVQVSYNSDMYLVRDTIVKAGNQLEWRAYSHEPFFRFQSFDNSGITVTIYVRIRNVKDRYEAKSDLNMLIWEHFKEANIEIPFPQLDLHIKKQLTELNAKVDELDIPSQQNEKPISESNMKHI